MVLTLKMICPNRFLIMPWEMPLMYCPWYVWFMTWVQRYRPMFWLWVPIGLYKFHELWCHASHTSWKETDMIDVFKNTVPACLFTRLDMKLKWMTLISDFPFPFCKCWLRLLLPLNFETVHTYSNQAFRSHFNTSMNWNWNVWRFDVHPKLVHDFWIFQLFKFLIFNY